MSEAKTTKSKVRWEDLVINGIVVGKIARDWERFVEEKKREMEETLRRFTEESWEGEPPGEPNMSARCEVRSAFVKR
jgi:hypothetical protein